MEAMATAILQRQEYFGHFILQSQDRVVISKRDKYIYLATWINANFASRSATEVKEMLEQAHAIVNIYINRLDAEEIKRLLGILLNSYARHGGLFDEDELKDICSALLTCMSHRNFTWFNRAPGNVTNTASILLEACNIFDMPLPLFEEMHLLPSVKLLDEKNYLLNNELYDQWQNFVVCNSYEDGIDLQRYNFTTPCVVEINGVDNENKNNINIRLYSYDTLLDWIKVSNKSCFNRQQFEIYKSEDGLGDFKKNVLLTPDQLIEYLIANPLLRVKIL